LAKNHGVNSRFKLGAYSGIYTYFPEFTFIKKSDFTRIIKKKKGPR